MKAVFSIYLLLVLTTGYSQSVNQHYYRIKSEDHLAQKKLTLAEQYADSALMVAVNTNDYDSLAAAYQLRQLVHEEKKDYQSSLADARMIIAYRDSAVQRRLRTASSEAKFIQQTEKQAHESELASLRDLIVNLEQNKREGRLSLVIIFFALIVLSVIAVIMVIRKRSQTLKLLEQTKLEEEKLHSFKKTLSYLLGSNLKDSLTSFEMMNKSLANQVESMDKEEAIEFLKRLEVTATDLKFKLNNVVQWVEYQADTNLFTPTNIESKELVQMVVTRLKSGMVAKNITSDIFMPHGQIVFADKQMIEVVLDNLVSNAIQHTPEGGTITIFAGQKDGLVTLGVKDTGRGMSKETISKLFTISTPDRIDQKGKGLGLVLSKELIERNGGRMYVESKEGEGSNFYFSLPEGKL